VVAVSIIRWLFARPPLVVATGGKSEAEVLGIARWLFARPPLVGTTGGKSEAVGA